MIAGGWIISFSPGADQMSRAIRPLCIQTHAHKTHLWKSFWESQNMMAMKRGSFFLLLGFKPIPRKSSSVELSTCFFFFWLERLSIQWNMHKCTINRTKYTLQKMKKKRKKDFSSRHLPSVVGGHPVKEKEKNIKDTFFLTFSLTLVCLCFFLLFWPSWPDKTQKTFFLPEHFTSLDAKPDGFRIYSIKINKLFFFL